MTGGPAERYLARALAPAAAPASAVELSMRGAMRLSPGGRWLPFRATEVLRARSAFEWRARVGPRGAPVVRVRDRYADGAGSVAPRLLGLVPLGRGAGPDVDRSARGRLAAEHVWLPSALRPGPGVSWRDAGPDTAVVGLTIDGEEIELTLDVAGDGRLRGLTMDRWGETGRGAFGPVPFGAVADGELAFPEGLRIPTRLRVMWRPGAGDEHEFFRVEVTGARFS